MILHHTEAEGVADAMIMAQKNGYVVGRPGWFSCRSACYLAAGRLVVVEDTGFSDIIPTGKGLCTFSTMEEAIEAVGEVERRYAMHAQAARELAEEFFDAWQVLSLLVETAMGAPLQGALKNESRRGAQLGTETTREPAECVNTDG